MSIGFGQPGTIATARWMLPDEVGQRFLFKPGSFWLGRNPDETDHPPSIWRDSTHHPIGYDDDRHVMLVAGSRGGKGTSIIVPNLCLWEGSAVVIDPKGENATLTAARRGPGSEHCDGLGQRVHVLDPMKVAKVDPALRSAFNPLDALNAHDPESVDEAGRIADALVDVGEGESAFWDESARAMVRTLILHVVTSPNFEGCRTLLSVRDLILRGDTDMEKRLREDGIEATKIPSPHVLLWRSITKNDAFGGRISAAAASFYESARNSPKQFGSFRAIADRSTEFLDSPGMAECVSRSSFALSELKTSPKGMSLFLSLPQRYMSTHYRWLRMITALAITEMEKTPGQPVCGHRVLFCLDEFAGMRRMRVIEENVPQIAGYGVKLLFVVQSLEQLKGVYPERWETFLANCGVRIFFATTDNFTNEYVSKALGEQELIRETENWSESLTDTETRGQSVGGGKSTQESHTTGENISRSETSGGGENWGEGGGRNRSHGGSTGTNKGRSGGMSRGWSYGPEWLFAPRTGRQRGENEGWNEGRNEGRTWSSGTQETWSRGGQESWSKTLQSGTSRTSGHSITESENWSENSSSAQARGKTSGGGQQIFKKPLVSIDEMEKLFRRIDDVTHSAYPGIALISIAGEYPILLRKTNYYEDRHFYRCFDPHPDHSPIDVLQRRRTLRIAQLPTPIFDENIPPDLSLVEAIHFFNNDTPETVFSFDYNTPAPIDFVWAFLMDLSNFEWAKTGRASLGRLPDRFTIGTRSIHHNDDAAVPAYVSACTPKSVFGLDMDRLRLRFHLSASKDGGTTILYERRTYKSAPKIDGHSTPSRSILIKLLDKIFIEPKIKKDHDPSIIARSDIKAFGDLCNAAWDNF